MEEFHFNVRTGETYINVGDATLRLFDIETGTVPVDAGTIPLPEADLETVILPELITAKDFPYKTGDFATQKDGKPWDVPRCLVFGRTILRILDSGPERPTDSRLTQTHINRFKILGKGPGYHPIRDGFHTMGGFREAIGVPVGRIYDPYHNSEQIVFTRHAQNVARAVGRRPRAPDYNDFYKRGEGPSIRTIAQRVGGVSILNERIGYPDIRSWEEENDFLDWGIRVMEANDDCILSTPLLNILSRRDRGPGTNTIGRNFGGLVNFREKIKKRQTELLADRIDTEKKWAARCDSLIARQIIIGITPELSIAEKSMIAMRYDLARHCLPVSPESSLATLAKNKEPIISEIRTRCDKIVSAAHIEMVAVSLQIFEYLWPGLHSLTGLRVEPKELQKERDRLYEFTRQRRSRV